MTTLRWTHPGNDATSFTAHLGLSPNIYTEHVELGLPVPAGDIYTAELAVPVGTYYALTAINAGGESDYSNVLVPEPASALLFGALLLWRLAKGAS